MMQSLSSAAVVIGALKLFKCDLELWPFKIVHPQGIFLKVKYIKIPKKYRISYIQNI